jgi:hypothetical protein
MADQLQLRGGTTTEHATFTGALREVTVDTTKDTVVVHDNATAGGHPLLREDLSNLPAGTIDNDDISATAEIAVSKLADGSARQLLQTDAAGTGVEWTSNVDVPGTLDVTNAATFDSTINASAGTASLPSITFTGDPNTGIYSPGADQLAVATNGVGRLFVNSDGRLLVGNPTSQLGFPQGGGIGLVQIEAAGAYSGLSLRHNNSSQNNRASFLGFIRSRTNAVGGTAAVQSGDYLGILTFAGTDGTNSVTSANIIGIADGTPSAGSVPGSITFNTGSPSPSERLRITAAGLVGIGTTSPAYQLQLSTDSAGKPSTNTWTIVSDERIKDDIELADLDICYDAVKNIPLKRFKWKDEVYTEQQVPDRHKLGWIAQDVEEVFPKAVRIHEFKYNQVFEETVIPAVEEELDDEGNVITPAQPERIEKGELISEEVIEDCRDLNADQLYAAMYGAIQKLIAKVETLEAKVASLENTSPNP